MDGKIFPKQKSKLAQELKVATAVKCSEIEDQRMLLPVVEMLSFLLIERFFCDQHKHS